MIMDITNINIVKTIIVLLLAFKVSYSQDIRLSAMGNVKIGIEGEYNSLNPYYFAGNPAYITLAEKSNYLKIAPSYSNEWGDYHKLWEADRVSSYKVNFTGVKNLSTDGTFLGSTSYNYDVRYGVNRTLKYNTYAGEAFFYNDTTKGDVRFDGPDVNFVYGNILFDNLYYGVSGSYKLLNGLKRVYSMAESLIRDISGSAGLAYYITPQLSVGTYIKYNDYKEKISSKDENLLDVDIFNFKGETYSINRRSNTITEQIRKRSFSTNLHIYYLGINNIEAVVQANITNLKDKFLIPYQSDGQSFQEWEDGYASFLYQEYKVKVNYKFSSSLMAGFQLNYFKDNSWSSNTPYNLLLWEWNVKNIEVGMGISYKTFVGLLAVDYLYGNVKADSMKYIDNRFANVSSDNSYIKVGYEKDINELLIMRLGYNYASIARDIFAGGKDIKYYAYTFGIGYKLTELIEFGFYIEYNNYLNKIEMNKHKSAVSSVILLKLNTF